MFDQIFTSEFDLCFKLPESHNCDDTKGFGEYKAHSEAVSRAYQMREADKRAASPWHSPFLIQARSRASSHNNRDVAFFGILNAAQDELTPSPPPPHLPFVSCKHAPSVRE